MTNSPYVYEHFKHVTPMPVRWSDLDALGHVNNAKYLTYFEQARITYFADMQLWDGNPTKTGLIMAKVVLEYKMPVFAEDQVRVLSRTSRLGGRSFDTQQAVVCTRDGKDHFAAVGTVTVVVFDYQTNTSVTIPDEWRAKLIAYEPAPIEGA